MWPVDQFGDSLVPVFFCLSLGFLA
ncbi:hypothetical protein SMALA_4969 [Streptomyces malaysiensis subsp. malaysiensis]|nr:hypothetical protein SMALA_4969 [Streptomyces malaysiensis]